MFNSSFFLRILIAVIGVIILLAIIPAFLRIVGFPVTADLMLIIKLVIAVIAVYYVFRGGALPPIV